MSATEFFQQVRTYFHYLFDTYDFAVANEEAPGNNIAVIELDSSTWRVVVSRDNSSVFVMVGPNQYGKRKLYDLGHVITFLEGGSEDEAMWFGSRIDMSREDIDRMLIYLEWWSDILKPYCDDLARFFAESFFIKEPDIEIWRWQVEKAIRNDLVGRKGGTEMNEKSMSND